jgi:ribosomal protein L24
VKGLNLVKRHLKRAQDGTGGITEKEASIHRSNVMLASLWEARQSKKPTAKKAKAAK